MQHRWRETGEREHGEIQETASNLIVFDLRILAHFQNDRPYIQVLSDIDTARVVLFAFRAGQRLEEHCSPDQILMQTLRGRVIVALSQGSFTLQAGLLLRLEADVPHSITARTDALMLLTITSDPIRHNQEGSDILRGHTPLVARTR